MLEISLFCKLVTMISFLEKGQKLFWRLICCLLKSARIYLLTPAQLISGSLCAFALCYVSWAIFSNLPSKTHYIVYDLARGILKELKTLFPIASALFLHSYGLLTCTKPLAGWSSSLQQCLMLSKVPSF